MDTVRTIGRSMGRFLSGTLLSRVAGFGRDVTLAALFGSSPALAAFLMAFRFVNLPRRLFGEGAMHAAFVPAYESLRKEDSLRARRLFDALSTVMALGLLALLALIATLLLFFRSQVVNFTLLMLPSTLFLCLYGLSTAYLNCERIYFLPSLAPVAFNLVLILGAWLAPDLQFLALLVPVSFAAQWGITLLRAQPRFTLRGELRPLWRPLLLGMAGVAATQINSALDPLFARLAAPEGPAYLWFAIRIQQMPLSLIGVALSGALLPPLARAVGTPDYHHFLRTALKRVTQTMVPLTLLLILLALPIVRLVYMRGAFTEMAAEETARCLVGYSLGLLPMALILVQTAALHAVKRYRITAWITAATVGINILLNAFLYRIGPEGVAYATALAAWLQTLLLRQQL